MPDSEPPSLLNATDSPDPAASRMTDYAPMRTKAAETIPQNTNQPIDYETKYPEDDAFNEMGPAARIWMVYLDECNKSDVQMVENWRDALNGLLVLAGMLSAVVTTFVCDTYQSLQPDFDETDAFDMYEVSELTRTAIFSGSDGVTSIPHSIHVPTSFRSSQSVLWANGLWFTSLSLSLTVALIDVLSKQWIHQYMSATTGTPRDRSRIRHFRYIHLLQWHVPVLIDLLPLLMLIALVFFFSGLIVFLHPLNRTIARVIGAIAAASFGVYIITNLLPLFKPACPYKTSLTFRSHSLLCNLWHQLEPVRHWFNPPAAPPDPSTYEGYIFQRDGPPSTELLSLKAIERRRVDSDARNIDDVQCLSWLFGASSNSSVQLVVMQAIGNLPLQYSGAIRDSIPSLRVTISDTMQSIQGKATERPVYERLFRALSRVEDDFTLPRCLNEPEPGDQRLSILADPNNSSSQAAEFLRAQLVNPTIDLDVISWALIMHSALHKGAGWLDVDVDHSEVWKALLPLLTGIHRCDARTNCDHSRKELVTLTVKLPLAPANKCPLTILDIEDTEQADPLWYAIQHFMFPSFVKLVLNEYGSSLAQCPPDLPADLAIQLNLLTSRAVRSVDIWKTALWGRIESIVGLEPPMGHDIIHRHPSIIMPLFDALLDALREDDFIETDTLSIHQKMDVCLFLFRTYDLEPNIQPHMRPVLVDPILQDIIEVAFIPSVMLPSPLVTDMLNFLSSSLSPLSADIYRLLRERQWLKEIEDVLLSWRSTLGRQHRQHFYDLSYPFLASAFVNGLEALRYVDAAEYSSTLAYFKTPSNLLRLSKLVLFADTARRKSLHILAEVVGEIGWAECSKALSDLLDGDGQTTFEYHATILRAKDPFNCRVRLQYGTYNDLKDFLRQTT